ncbi:hypothetical protein CCACVL1_25726, partial [Corchorus capsularis]
IGASANPKAKQPSSSQPNPSASKRPMHQGF